MTGAVQAGAKILRSLLQKYDLVLTERGFEYSGESSDYKALTDEQKAQLERFHEWWFGMLVFAAGTEGE